MTKGEQTAQHILATASDLFWRRNYNGVSVDEIAEAAGVNKATIYRYYPSKEDLAQAVIRRDGNLTIDCIFKTAFEESSAPAERLDAIYRRLYDSHQRIFDADRDQRGCPIANLAVELGADMPEIRQLADEIFSTVRLYLLDIARDALASRADKAWTADDLADALLQIQHGALVMARLEGRPEALLRAGAAAQRLIA